MWNRGALAIGTMVAVGVVLAIVAVWFHHQQGRRCLELWGSEQANRIRHAPEVEALRLEALEADAAEELAAAERLAVGDRCWKILARRDVSAARGLVHARHALVVDVNYDWEEPSDEQTTGGTPRFEYALVFRDGSRQTTLLCDFTSGQLETTDGRRGRLVPQLAAAERAFLERELGPP